MRRTIHATLLALALLAPAALAQVTYLALEPHATLEAAEQQAATLHAHGTTVITETNKVPGFESINLQQHTYRVLVGPLSESELDTVRAELTQAGHQTQVTNLAAEAQAAYQVQVGAYRSDRLAQDARDALTALGEPTFTHAAPPFTFVHAGPYDTREDAQAALERIHAAGITSRAVLATLTPEHQEAIASAPQEAPEQAVAEAPAPEPTTGPSRLPIPVLEPTAAVAAAPEEPAQPQAPTSTATAESVEDGTLTSEDPTSHPEAEAVAEEREPDPVYVHVASGRTAAEFTAPLATLEALGLAPDVRLATGGAYRLYVGPMTPEEAVELRQALREEGLASFSTPTPTGQTAALPEPEPAAIAETPEAPEQEPVAEAAEAQAEEAETAAGHAAEEAEEATEMTEALPEPEAQAVTETPEAPEGEPAAEVAEAASEEVEVATDEATADGEDPLAESTTEEETVAEDSAWEPQQEILAGRTQLQPGAYLTARTTDNITELQTPYDTLTDMGLELAFMQAGDRTVLLVGPLAEWQEDTVRKQILQKGMDAHTIHHPDYQPQTAEITTAITDATSPTNYLALDLNPDATLADLTTLELEAELSVLVIDGQTLVGPIPNEELELTARALTQYATVAFHPYPAEPENASADDWTEHAYTLLDYQLADLARQAFLEARALDATHYGALFGLAVSEDALGNRDAAEFAYQYVMSAHPERFEARFNYALRTHRDAGAAAAIAHYQQALQLAADLPADTRAQAHSALADALSAVNDHSGAAQHYQSAFELVGDLDHLVARFKAQRASGQGLDLLPELTGYELETRDTRFTALIADIYAQANQTAYALDTINRRMRDDLEPAQEALLLNARAATHAAAGNHTQALTDLEAAFELAPGDATTRHNLGLTLLAQGKASEALPHLQAAVDHGVTDPLARLDLAEAAYGANAPHLAAEHATAAAEALTGPERDRALLLHVQATHATWDYLASIPSLEALLQNNPGDARLLTLAGTAYYQTGQYARAAERLETAHNLTGDDTINAALINAYLASQRYADAERALRATLAVTPEDADALHKLGWALLHLGQHQDAKNAWTDAIALNHTQAKTDLASVFQ